MNPPASTPAETTTATATLADRLRGLAIGSLARMFRPDDGLFVFRVRRNGGDVLPEGVSTRYTAIVLIALAHESPETISAVLGGRHVADVCTRLAPRTCAADNLGDVALTLWACRALRHDAAGVVLDRMRDLDPVAGPHPTVEVAWSLSALTAGHATGAEDADLADRIARRLRACRRAGSGLFPHWPTDAGGSRLRGHVTCFADLVYPIQALAHHHATAGDRESAATAIACADRMCALQGDAGQWWWHYDVRTGRVIEPYPVYAVHQDAMAPMALFDLRDACGADHTGAIDRGMRWLLEAPELPESLVDHDAGVIWRKVARHEPRKLARGMQALASRVHPALRTPGVATLLPPGAVDFESRPYHLGWLLYAWRPDRRVPRASGTIGGRIHA